MVLFDTSVEGKLACGWDSGVLHQRTRTVKAGPMVYVDCYPVWDTAHARAASTEAKKEAHARAQKRLDAKNRANRLERLVNANFGAGDIMLTCEYPAGRQPGSDEQAKRDIRNMMNRVKRMRSAAVCLRSGIFTSPSGRRARPTACAGITMSSCPATG